MHSLTLAGLLPDCDLPPGAATIPVAGLSADSREIQPGFVFFALPGLHVDGASFATQAVARGAIAVVAEQVPEGLGAPVVRVDHCRSVLSRAASIWYGAPSQDLVVLGVTGTDGKSSTVYFTQQLLEAAGCSAGFFSTVAFKAEDVVEDNSFRQSTLEALELNGMLARMRAHGHTHAVIESTSHGLSHRTARLKDIRFCGAAFTNLSHEHLEFHGTYEQYAHDKANLFRGLKPLPDGRDPASVINAGDAMGAYMASQANGRVLYYQVLSGPGQVLADPPPMLWADGLEAVQGGLSFRLHHGTEVRQARIPLVGMFNVENVLAAMLLASDCLGMHPFELIPHLGGLKSVKGRMVVVDEGQDFTVVVDYAHTPGAFQKVLPAMKASCPGRLIVVFGSGGERDREKRPIQGKLAAAHASVIILANEDPRLEDPMQILEEIKAGIPQGDNAPMVELIPERDEAVRRACELARSGDLVALLGKGHEQSIIKADEKHPWDEETAARQALRKIVKHRKEAQ